ncbi:hypothetical protein EYF80_020257 [Liparis tanakae]|uniref:Secreted protein n=1 Tax=Liparis tanakae TaxID=230148 RepID=A0A4Z2HXG2_9TELE|nr:hypothetical protein EYF80_020257 [Liparis tanakae]
MGGPLWLVHHLPALLVCLLAECRPSASDVKRHAKPARPAVGESTHQGGGREIKGDDGRRRKNVESRAPCAVRSARRPSEGPESLRAPGAPPDRRHRPAELLKVAATSLIKPRGVSLRSKSFITDGLPRLTPTSLLHRRP